MLWVSKNPPMLTNSAESGNDLAATSPVYGTSAEGYSGIPSWENKPSERSTHPSPTASFRSRSSCTRLAAPRQHNEEKIRLVLEGLRGEESIAELCRREGINRNL